MGTVIVITGAGAGLGRALARRLANDGRQIIALGRNLARLQCVVDEIGQDARAVTCDVSSPGSVREAFREIARTHQTIDALINNAAVYQPSFVKDASDAHIEAALLTNLSGPIHCSREAIPLMRRGGQIINISSETVGMNHAMFSLYQSSKAGLERFSAALHDELEPDGIRVTLVRAGQMMDVDSTPPQVDPGVLRQFAVENMKRGLDFRTRPTSSFASVAEIVRGLTLLPADVHVPSIVLEARRC